MGFKNLVFLVLVSFGFSLKAVAQRDSISLTTIVTKTDKLSAEHPFEKVYLHFDKPYYAIGDTLWFKAYLTVGPKHVLSGLSGVIYVDVINDRDSLVQSLKLPATGGLAVGDVILRRTSYQQGNYHIRAYTNWMRNFDADYFFNKTITVGDAVYNTVAPQVTFQHLKKDNKDVVSARLLFKDHDGNIYAEKKVSWTVQNGDETVSKGKGTTDKNGVLNVTLANDVSTSNSPNLVAVIDLGKKSVTNTFALTSAFAQADVQFFPEGGDLIAGVRSKVAFKAVNASGLGVDVTGSVSDNENNEVADLTSQHNGMGVFALLPQDGKTYKATVNYPDGSKHIYDLPKVLSDGITLGVNNNDPDNLNVKIATNAAYFKQYQNKGFYIVAQSGGVIYYTGLAALQSLVYTAAIPKNKFPTGVLQVTLLASNGEPLSERLVFIQHNDALSITLTGQPSYKKLQHVSLNVAAKNGASPANGGNFSVAVIDESKVPYNDDAETTILSNLLLTSDLRGFIEKPNYYFSSADAKKQAELDILLLTQGYRRFSYSDILADKYPPITHKAERGIEISGTLRTASGVPVFNGTVNMSVPDRALSTNATTDAEGHFSFQNVSMYDSSKVTLSSRNNTNGNNLMIMADVATVQPLPKNYNDPGVSPNIDSTMGAYLQNAKKQNESMHVLKEVVIKGDRPKKVNHEPYTALIGLGIEADQVLGQDILKYCSFDFEGCIMGKVFGIWHYEDHYYIKKDYDNGNTTPVKFFVNGLGVDDGYLRNINPADIESIEVYLKDGVAGTFQFLHCNGILSITTKTHNLDPGNAKAGDISFLTAQPSNVTLSPKGYYKTRVFYSPKYSATITAPEVNDYRSTIYWNPNITTDKNGNATFDLYNGTGAGTYRAIIEGIDSDGNIGRYVFRYEVK